MSQRLVCPQIGLGVSMAMGVPKNGWLTMENLIQMDDLGLPLFSETTLMVFKCVFVEKRLMMFERDDDNTGNSNGYSQIKL